MEQGLAHIADLNNTLVLVATGAKGVWWVFEKQGVDFRSFSATPVIDRGSKAMLFVKAIAKANMMSGTINKRRSATSGWMVVVLWRQRKKAQWPHSSNARRSNSVYSKKLFKYNKYRRESVWVWTRTDSRAKIPPYRRYFSREYWCDGRAATRLWLSKLPCCALSLAFRSISKWFVFL